MTDDILKKKSLVARIRGEHGYLRGRRGELADNIVISDISVHQIDYEFGLGNSISPPQGRLVV